MSDSPENSSPAAAPPAPPPGTPEAAAQQPPLGAEPEGPQDEKSVGELVFEISEQASILVREEIELAKAEVTGKFNTLLRGGVVGIVAGVFLLAALILTMHAFAWLLNDLFFEDAVWAGFAIEALLFVLIAAGAGYYAYRSFSKTGAPVPEMAMEEAKEIRATFDGSDEVRESTPS